MLAHDPMEAHKVYLSDASMQHVLGMSMHGFKCCLHIAILPLPNLSVCAAGHHGGLQAWGANSPDGGFRRRKDHTHGRAG